MRDKKRNVIPADQYNVKTTHDKAFQDSGYTCSAFKKIKLSVKYVRKYTTEQISEAFMLRSISKKAYETVRSCNFSVYPLPSIRTLCRRISNFLCPPGIQEDLFSLLKAKFNNSDDYISEAVIMFDEMQLKESCDFNDRLKKLFIRHKKVQVVQVRGLIKPWKQIIYNDFDQNMNMDLLNELILKSENCNMKIRDIICDMGNTQLLSNFKVYRDHNNVFKNDNNRNIYIICDNPHCFNKTRGLKVDPRKHKTFTSCQA